MRYDDIGGYNSVYAFVKNKIDGFKNMPKTFENIFNEMFSNKKALFYERDNGYRTEKITYEQAENLILERASVLSALISAPKNSVIGIYKNNSLDWLVSFWAILRAGYNPLLLNTRLSENLIENALKQTDCVCVISDEKTFSVKTLFSSDLSSATEKGVLDGFGTEMYFMSSGTSQCVKICAYSAEEICPQILNSYYIIKKCSPIKEHYKGKLKLLTLLPFYHIFGFVAVYVWFTFFGRTLVELKDFSASTVLSTIKMHKVTHVFAVPLFWEKVKDGAIKVIKQRGEKTFNKFNKGLKLSVSLGNAPLIAKSFRKSAFKEVRENLFGDSVKFMITGGGNVDKSVLEFFNGIGYRLVNGYGLTEMGITSVELSNNFKTIVSGSVGKPLPNVEYKINRDNELLIKCLTGCKYLISDGEKVLIKNSYYNTHDIAEIKNGNYFIRARSDELIVCSNGENVNPYLIEEKVKVDGASVCLIKDEKTNSPVLIVSVNEYLSENGKNDVLTKVKNTVFNYGLTDKVGKIVLTSKPLLSENDFKFNRKSILQKYENGYFEEAPKTQDGNLSPLESKVISLISETLNAEKVNTTDDFFLDLGGTSLDYFSFVMQLQEEFNVSFPVNAEKSLTTATDIAKFIEKSLL